MLHLQPVKVLHSLQFVPQQSVFVIVVLQISVDRRVHVIERLLNRCLALLVLIQPTLALLQGLPQTLDFNIGVSLHRCDDFDGDIFHELSLQLLKLLLRVELFDLLDAGVASLIAVRKSFQNLVEVHHIVSEVVLLVLQPVNLVVNIRAQLISPSSEELVMLVNQILEAMHLLEQNLPDVTDLFFDLRHRILQVFLQVQSTLSPELPDSAFLAPKVRSWLV